MAANRDLAKQRGLSEDTISHIDFIHDKLDFLLENAKYIEDQDEAVETFREAEYALQKLWGFSADSRYHTWTHMFLGAFREVDYLGAVYRCKDSGETRTIDSQALHGSHLVGVGNGFINFGSVVRIVGNLERVK